MSALPSHICPRCKRALQEEEFTNAKGETRRWCVDCRMEHRQAIIGRQAAKKASSLEPTLAEVAKREGYQNSKLANLLALAHLAGEKRALAIRDGKSWRGKKAWREYYRAREELDNQLQERDKETT